MGTKMKMDPLDYILPDHWLDFRSERPHAKSTLSRFAKSFINRDEWTPLVKGTAIQAMLDMRAEVLGDDFLIDGESNPFLWLAVSTPDNLDADTPLEMIEEQLLARAEHAIVDYKKGCELLAVENYKEGARLLYRGRGWWLLLATIGGVIYPEMKRDVQELWTQLSEGLVYTNHVQKFLVADDTFSGIEPDFYLVNGFQSVVGHLLDESGHFNEIHTERWLKILEIELANKSGHPQHAERSLQ